ncbi:alpha beta hydrolase fold protein [Leptolyngbya sp. Heron Island J]|uniref:alpha/beta fold hydrolase n=1 Tax=Leptolyngbya sp. Heron Island J TaxID=1385935 RepID=UPI0003B9D265|nr:alpha/beta fold hydrolase [Leptolyngbya sp. Heron Island J]ESA34877.1 alpha beta hydrolase fold protein [Leptolyngbya sp. Heron Island J]
MVTNRERMGDSMAMQREQTLGRMVMYLGTVGLLTLGTGLNAANGMAPISSTLAEVPISTARISRQDFRIESDPGIEIFVREVGSQSEAAGVPILLIHGGGPGGLASFDLEVPGYSLAANFAQAGHSVYVMNVRGWESSTRPEGLDEPAANNPPLVTSEAAVRDIGAVVGWIRDRTAQSQVALVGWATGGHWAGLYTSQNNEAISHLVMLNSLYGVNAPWPLTERFEDPDHPGRFNPDGGAYRLVDYDGFLRGWDHSIPVDDKTQWRDPAVADAYARRAVELDPTSKTRTPPSARIPTAYREESFNLAQGYRYWSAEDIYTPTLGLRGELDFWSRPEDLSALETDLINAPVVEIVTIPDATHYLFNDRPERGRHQFVQTVLAFLID